MELSAMKLYLRIDGTDDDVLIQSLITAAKSFIENSTGKTYVADSEIWNLAIKLLVSHWYENRGVEAIGSTTRISYSIDALINHIALCGEFQ